MPGMACGRAESPRFLQLAGVEDAVIELGEFVMILDLHRQGLSVSAIARQVGVDRKTVRTYGSPKGWSRRPTRSARRLLGVIDSFEPYLRERLAAFPALTARRLLRELKELDFPGGYSVVRDRVRDVRPAHSAGYELRFETPPGEQAQVDFARVRGRVRRRAGRSNALSGCSRWCLATAA